MKPIKTLLPFSSWLMRLAVLFFVIMRYWETISFLNYKSVLFYVSFIFILSAASLFVGGFLKKDRLTIVSSVVLILVTGYHAFLNLKSGIDHNFAVFAVLGSIFFYFLATGNNRK
ncbi:MAG: hypothetical protein RBT49_09655 [Bacteroidales bacterium]|nr:hypothetical protein [Bacteroidales bacterium]